MDVCSQLFAKALQQLIKADPDYLTFVLDLNGASLKLNLTEWAVSIVFLPEELGLKILSADEFEQQSAASLEKHSSRHSSQFPDVSISGKLPDFLGLMRAESSSLIKSHVQIQGDVRVLARYQAFFQRWNIDFGHVLASCLGEGPARLLHQPLKKLSEFLKYQREERMQDLKEVLYEEKQLLVPKAELEIFYDEIKQLQMRVDRLGALIAHDKSI